MMKDDEYGFKFEKTGVLTVASSPSLAAFFRVFFKSASSFLIAWSRAASSLKPSDWRILCDQDVV